MRCYLKKRPAEAVVLLERYDKANQALLVCLLPLAARLAEAGDHRSDPREVGELLAQLDSAVDLLRPKAQLSIEKMCFCTDIRRYGVYEPLDEDHEFRPGDCAQLYVELRNFSSEQQGNEHSIRLASTVEILRFNRESVWRQVCHGEDHPDRSKTQRHDFFNNYPFIVPNLPPGHYTLKLQVVDVPTSRPAERTLDFRVGPGRGS
jgi:hypothetical protein